MGYVPWNGRGNAYANITPAAATNDIYQASWGYQILPYVELDNLYKSFTGALGAAPNASQVLPLKVFLCPGRGRPGSGTSGRMGPLTDYAINAAVNDDNGTLGAVNNKRRIETIGDGSSNTIAVGHKYIPRNLYAVSNASNWDESILVGGMGGSGRSSTELKQDAPSTVLNTGNRWGAPFPSGAVFVMYDGSVRSIRYSIPQGGAINPSPITGLSTFGRMLRGNDGQVFNAD